MQNLQYPIGEFIYPTTISQIQMETYIENIKNMPKELALILKNCPLDDFKKTYRDGGWNIGQIINHLVDSHLNAFLRLKFALLEDDFSAKLYNENDWVKTPENTILNCLSSIELLKHLHFRWAELLSHLSEVQQKRTFFNPYSKRHLSLQQHSALYAWHSKHHLEHIKIALKK